MWENAQFLNYLFPWKEEASFQVFTGHSVIFLLIGSGEQASSLKVDITDIVLLSLILPYYKSISQEDLIVSDLNRNMLTTFH